MIYFDCLMLADIVSYMSVSGQKNKEKMDPKMGFFELLSIFSSIFTRPKNSDSFLENSIIVPLHEDSTHDVFSPHLLQTFCIGQNTMLQFLHLQI